MFFAFVRNAPYLRASHTLLDAPALPYLRTSPITRFGLEWSATVKGLTYAPALPYVCTSQTLLTRPAASLLLVVGEYIAKPNCVFCWLCPQLSLPMLPGASETIWMKRPCQQTYGLPALNNKEIRRRILFKTSLLFNVDLPPWGREGPTKSLVICFVCATVCNKKLKYILASFKAVYDTPIARITGCVSSLRI